MPSVISCEPFCTLLNRLTMWSYEYPTRSLSVRYICVIAENEFLPLRLFPLILLYSRLNTLTPVRHPAPSQNRWPKMNIAFTSRLVGPLKSSFTSRLGRKSNPRLRLNSAPPMKYICRLRRMLSVVVLSQRKMLLLWSPDSRSITDTPAYHFGL